MDPVLNLDTAKLQQVFQQDTGPIRSGCYIENVEKLGLSYKNAMVPLRHLDYHLEITNSLLNITLTQNYFNPTQKFIQVHYCLPLSPQSSIYSFEVSFNNVKLLGTIKQKQQAKKEYQKAMSQGKKVAIASIDSDSKDILNMSIGNIPAQTQFVVKISFLQEMQISMNTFYRLLIPSTISPRYLNKIQDKLKVPQHMKIKGQLSGKPDFTWNFKIDLKTKRKVTICQSSSHKINLLNRNNQGTQLLYVMQNSQIPNRDFCLLYSTQDFHLPSQVLGKSDISTTLMLSFIPKFCTLNTSDALKAQKQNKPYQVDIDSARGDYIFFLDRSGSMSGERIIKAKQALLMFLKSLPEDSYFNVISFGDSSQKLFNNSQRYSSQKFLQAKNVISGMDADLGGTQIYDPLQNLLTQHVQQGYPRHVFLLTDGGVSNTQGVISMVKKNVRYSRVHCIGIGNGVSLDLIQGCAKVGKGKYVTISDNQNPSNKIIQLLQATLTPVITKIDLKIHHLQNLQSIIPNPKEVPYILKNDLINFYVTYNGSKLPQKIQFDFQYKDSVSKNNYTSNITVDTINSKNFAFVDRMSHLKVLRTLQTLSKQNGTIEDHMYYVKVKDYKQQAIDYSIRHQVLSEYTAFICVGKQLVDGEYQQYLQSDLVSVQVSLPKPIQYLQNEMMYQSCCLMNLQDQQQCYQMDMEDQNEIMQCCCEPQVAQFYSRDSAVNNYKLQQQCQEIKQKQQVLQCRQQVAKKQENKQIYSGGISIQKVVDSQNINGSWSDKSLIKLSKNEEQVEKYVQQYGWDIVITQLVILWMQRYHTDKQYTLIIKKALAWLKKKTEEMKFDIKLLQNIETA